MGQKVNPHGLRVGIIRNWDSRWFVRDDQFGDLVVEDDKIRKFVKKKIASAGVPKIEIERNGGRVKVIRSLCKTRRGYRQGRHRDRKA